MVAERREGTRVGGHRVVGEVAAHHRPQPTSLLCGILVPAPPEVFSYLQQLRHLSVTSRMAGQQEAAPLRSCADVREPQEVEGPRFALPTRRSRSRGPSTKLDQTGLVGVQFQGELRHPVA